MRFKNLEGKRFGKLIVIKRLEPQRGRSVKWICKCDCGNDTIVQRSNLENGSSKSCGQHRFNDLNGKRFGKLTCIKKGNGAPYRNGTKTTWICKCDCGNEKEILASQLISKMTRSCGCLRKQKLHELYFKGYNDISGKYWSTVRGGAKRRSLEFNITMQDVWNLYIKQNKKCTLSGKDIIFSLQINESTASIDRIDNTKGYILNNIQIVHKRINLMKNNLTQEIFIDYCKHVAYNCK